MERNGWPLAGLILTAALLGFSACDAPLAAATDGLPNRLSALTVSAGTLAPAFSPEVFSYSLTVPNATAAVTLAGDRANSRSVLTQTGPASLAVGANTYRLRLQLGADTVTYQVTVVRDLARSSVSALSALAYTGTGAGGSTGVQTGMNPPFAQTHQDYAVTVTNGVTAVTFAPTKLDPKSSVTQTGGSALAVGTNPVVLKVTAEDGVTTTEYRVTVTRLSWGTVATVPPSNDCALAGLSAADTTGGGSAALSLAPVFDPLVTDYLLQVPNAVTDVRLTPAVHQAAALADPLALAALPVGYTPGLITVTAEDGSSTVYRIMVQRLASGTTVLSANSTLSSLTVKAGAAAVTLNPAFSPTVTAYTGTLPAGTSSVTVTPVRADSTATLGTVTGTTGLTTGANTVTIPVTAQDGSATTYTVTLNNPAPVSTVSTLASLSLNGLTLSPAFSPSVLTYSATAAAGAASVTVGASATDPLASVVVTGATGLVVGANAVKVTVTATDGVSKSVYTVSVTVPAGTGGSGFSGTAALTGSATYGGSSHAAFWVWVTDSTGAYVDTLLYYPQSQSQISTSASSNAWVASKTSTTTDGTSSATWTNGTKRTFTWDFKNSKGVLMSPGTYTFRIMVFQQSGGGQTQSSATLTLGTSAVTGTFSPLGTVVSAGTLGYTP